MCMEFSKHKYFKIKCVEGVLFLNRRQEHMGFSMHQSTWNPFLTDAQRQLYTHTPCSSQSCGVMPTSKAKTNRLSDFSRSCNHQKEGPHLHTSSCVSWHSTLNLIFREAASLLPPLWQIGLRGAASCKFSTRRKLE